MINHSDDTSRGKSDYWTSSEAKIPLSPSLGFIGAVVEVGHSGHHAVFVFDDLRSEWATMVRRSTTC